MRLRLQRSPSKTSTPVTWRQSPSPARKAFVARSPDIRSGWPSCFPFTSRLHPIRFQPLSHELSVHTILFQALFTLFSKFFWVFLHSTSSLSVFLLYLDFDEYYHLFNLYFQINLLCTRDNPFHFSQRLRGFHSPWPTFPCGSHQHPRLNHPVQGYTAPPVFWLRATKTLPDDAHTNSAFFFFIRHYSRNHGYFFFLPLLICLS